MEMIAASLSIETCQRRSSATQTLSLLEKMKRMTNKYTYNAEGVAREFLLQLNSNFQK